MSESNGEFSDGDFEAFLHESEKQAESDRFHEVVRNDVATQFDAVLAAHGYTPLDEDPIRYEAVLAALERELIDETEKKYGSVPDSQAFAAATRKMATVRLLDLQNVEKFLIEYSVGYGHLIEIAARLDQQQTVEKLSTDVSDGKREVFANMVVRRGIAADNPALQAMAAYLPGGDISVNDESMMPYVAASIAGLSEARERNERLNDVRKRAFELIGFDPDLVDPKELLDEREYHVSLLVQKGLLFADRSVAKREATLYEYAREDCPSLTLQNVRDIIGLINEEYPAS